MDKRFLAILAVVVIVFGGIFYFNSSRTKTTTGTPTNHIFGMVGSKVKLVEYGDYQCNVCQTYAATTNAIRTKYADRVEFQFRNLPLTEIHPNAFAAARAAEAADKQGKFWEMHDLLYNYNNWLSWTTASDPTTLLSQYATQLGLNVETFKTDFKSTAVNDTINADSAEFDKTKAPKATPTFFLNGKQVELGSLVDSSNAPSVDAFSAVLDEALQKAQ